MKRFILFSLILATVVYSYDLDPTTLELLIIQSDRGDFGYTTRDTVLSEVHVYRKTIGDYYVKTGNTSRSSVIKPIVLKSFIEWE